MAGAGAGPGAEEFARDGGLAAHRPRSRAAPTSDRTSSSPPRTAGRAGFGDEMFERVVVFGHPSS
ncbi:hypothetical protein ACFFRL_19605 [Agromyces hippuratus]|uniref:hypothetical protein n=1 Tax=Agromyces hippuratus TaxID=286438 RepID=UPI0035F008EB